MIFSVFQKKLVFGYSWSTLLWYWCYYPHRSRDALSPVCGIFHNVLIKINPECYKICFTAYQTTPLTQTMWQSQEMVLTIHKLVNCQTQSSSLTGPNLSWSWGLAGHDCYNPMAQKCPKVLYCTALYCTVLY